MTTMQTSPPQEVLHIANFIDARPLSASQYAIACLCGFVMFLDGFNTQTISYMTPLIAKEWQLSHQILGPILASALAGLLVGYLFLSPLSDRLGHRRMVLMATIVVGAFTLTTLLATNAPELIALRFITGMGLGAAIPSAVALFVNWMRPRTVRCSSSVDLEARHPLLQVGCSNRLDADMKSRLLHQNAGQRTFAVIHGVTKRGPRVSSMTQRMTCSALSFCSGHIETVTLRFSPRFGSPPVSRALTNSNAATALLAGPSHNSAVNGVTRSTHTFGSSGPFHHISSVAFQISAALAGSRRTSARAVIER